MKRLCVPLICAAMLLGVAHPAIGADRWNRVITDHFETVGNASDNDVRRIAQTLEQFHDVFVDAILRGSGEQPLRTVVLVFKDDISFTPYKPQGSGKSSIGGYFSWTDDQVVLALNASDLSYAFRAVLNGYSRAVVSQTVGEVPYWVGSGVGQVYQSFEERNGGKGALIGRPDQSVVETLRTGTILPLSKFVTTTPRDAGMTLGTRSREQFDAQAWALVHYLSFSERRAQFQRYLAALRSGDAEDQALVAAFGDVDQLERELREYVGKFTFPALQIAFDENVRPQLPGRSEVLKEPDAEAYLGVLLTITGHTDESRTRLERAMAATPDSAPVAAALAHLEYASGRFDRSLELLERAAVLAPSDERIQARLGRQLALTASRRNGGPTPEEVERVRSVLTRAIVLKSDNSAALSDLGWMLLYEPEDPGRAVTILSRAIALGPGRERLKLLLSDALLRERRYDEARTLLGPLMGRGSTPEVRADARRLLASITDRQRRDITGSSSRSASASASSPTVAAPVEATATTNASAGATSDQTDAISTAGRPRTSSGFVPLLRRLETGESRVSGMLTAIECATARLALVLETDGRTLKFGLDKFENVQFLSYRQEAPARVGCGPVVPPQRVLATYRASAVAGEAGTAVAIELIPDDFPNNIK